jgi:hypothetical protein
MGLNVENIPDIIHGQLDGDDYVIPGRHLGVAGIDLHGPAISFAQWFETIKAAREGDRPRWLAAHGPAAAWVSSQPPAYVDARWARDTRIAAAQSLVG